jgi:hypothetical protein
MTQLVALLLDGRNSDGRVDSTTGWPRDAGGGGKDAVTTGARTLEEALGNVAPSTRSIIERLREAAAPETIGLEFGLTVKQALG